MHFCTVHYIQSPQFILTAYFIDMASLSVHCQVTLLHEAHTLMPNYIIFYLKPILAI